MWRGAGVGLMAAAVLAGCGSGSGRTPPAPCPRISILGDGADLTRYRDGAVPDVSTVVVDARLIGFRAKCDYTRRRDSVAVTLSAIFDVERGPVTRTRSAELPWFIAVTDADDTQLIDRQEFRAGVEFDANVGRAQVVTRPVVVNLPADERRVENYNLRLSFQLTPEQVELNRRRGPR